jgi:hypothetical protein
VRNVFLICIESLFKTVEKNSLFAGKLTPKHCDSCGPKLPPDMISNCLKFGEFWLEAQMKANANQRNDITSLRKSASQPDIDIC